MSRRQIIVPIAVFALLSLAVSLIIDTVFAAGTEKFQRVIRVGDTIFRRVDSNKAEYRADGKAQKGENRNRNDYLPP